MRTRRPPADPAFIPELPPPPGASRARRRRRARASPEFFSFLCTFICHVLFYAYLTLNLNKYFFLGHQLNRAPQSGNNTPTARRLSVLAVDSCGSARARLRRIPGVLTHITKNTNANANATTTTTTTTTITILLLLLLVIIIIISLFHYFIISLLLLSLGGHPVPDQLGPGEAGGLDLRRGKDKLYTFFVFLLHIIL